jgi:hypothetical protein
MGQGTRFLRQAFTPTIVALAFLLAMPSPALAWDHSAVDALNNHKSDRELELTAPNAPCRLPNVLARLQWLTDDLALAREALDSLMTQQRRVTSEEDSLESKYEAIHAHTDMSGRPDVPRLHELAAEAAAISKAMDAVEARRQADLTELDLLSKKPPCVETPPPPPPPPPTPPPPVGPAGGTPTHRTTSCEQCRKAADALNAASDRLLADQGDPRITPAQLVIDQADIKSKADALDSCEKACHEHSSFFDNLHFGVGVGVGVGGGDDHEHGGHGDH